MEHLTRQEIVLYHRNRGLSFAQRQEIEQHLQLCEKVLKIWWKTTQGNARIASKIYTL